MKDEFLSIDWFLRIIIFLWVTYLSWLVYLAVKINYSDYIYESYKFIYINKIEIVAFVVVFCFLLNLINFIILKKD